MLRIPLIKYITNIQYSDNFRRQFSETILNDYGIVMALIYVSFFYSCVKFYSLTFYFYFLCLFFLTVKFSEKRADDQNDELDADPEKNEIAHLEQKPIKSLGSTLYTPDYVSYINPSILMSIFKKDKTLEEYIVIIVPLFSNVENVRFHVSADGLLGFIKFNWPKVTYEVRALFEKENPVESEPKILSLLEQLGKCRDSHVDVPESIVQVQFPFPIQTQPSNHILVGYNETSVGCKMLKIEVPAVRKYYSKTEKVVSFDN